MPSRAANHFNRCALLQKGFGCGTRREIRTNAQSVIKHSPPNHLQVVPRHGTTMVMDVNCSVSAAMVVPHGGNQI